MLQRIHGHGTWPNMLLLVNVQSNMSAEAAEGLPKSSRPYADVTLFERSDRRIYGVGIVFGGADRVVEV